MLKAQRSGVGWQQTKMVLLSVPSLLLSFLSSRVSSHHPLSPDMKGSEDNPQNGSCSSRRLPSRKQTAVTASPPRWIRNLISYENSQAPVLQSADKTGPRSNLPYKLMYRMQLSTTSGIACPESLRKRNRELYWARQPLLENRHCKHRLQTQARVLVPSD